jgi:hypothetical protein
VSVGAIVRAWAARAGQVGYSLVARWARTKPPRLEHVLTSKERALYERLDHADRAHALRVLSRVEKAGLTHPALLKAALLHDVGKADAGIRLPHRILRVALGAAMPRLLARLGARPHGWQRPFYMLAHHAAVGAAWLEAVGSDELTVNLVRYHEGREVPPALTAHAELLRALRRADDDG